MAVADRHPGKQFQSTHPHRMRPRIRALLLRILLFQSTHPHRMRRLVEVLEREARSNFNPRIHTGCDIVLAIDEVALVKFQSTHPHRMRQPIIVARKPLADFNPRIHTGCDNTLASQVRWITRFQSTHPHRMRRNSIETVRYGLLFQSTHPHRMRRESNENNTVAMSNFNPRIHTGCDRGLPQVEIGETEISIHASTQDATNLYFAGILRMGISIHASTQDATVSMSKDFAKVGFQSTHPHRMRRPSSP